MKVWIVLAEENYGAAAGIRYVVGAYKTREIAFKAVAKMRQEENEGKGYYTFACEVEES